MRSSVRHRGIAMVGTLGLLDGLVAVVDGRIDEP
jgi:hypothetical protein